MWDERYAGADYAYGTQPNTFLRKHVTWVTGPVLSICEGEGRNAVFLAEQGHSVHCVDSSAVGLRKAQKLAHQRGVKITTEVVDLEHYLPKPQSFQTIISIFAHLPSSLRARCYPILQESLAGGGIWLMEAYAEEQLVRSTGGPRQLDMLMSISKVKADFRTWTAHLLRHCERNVVEGQYHTGLADVVQFIGQKEV